MKRRAYVVLIAALSLICPMSVAAQGRLQYSAKKVVAHKNFGQTGSEAWIVKDDDGDTLAMGCDIIIKSIGFTQYRKQEDGNVYSHWWIDSGAKVVVPSFIMIDKRVVQLIPMPWRLSKPGKNGITSSWGMNLMMFRDAEGDPWLPMTFLTDDISRSKTSRLALVDLNAKSASPVFIDIDGPDLRKSLKWCIRETLRDYPEGTVAEKLTR